MANIIPSTFRLVTGRRLVFTVMLIAATILLGAVGFRILERDEWLESFYMSTQTVTTVGYGDLAPNTKPGRLFAIFLMLTGVGTVLYALTVVAQSVIQSEMVEAFSARRKKKEMKKLDGHYIVCGAGRVGRRIIRHLAGQGLTFVVIERVERRLEDLSEQPEHLIIGDATSEEILIEAGVKRARGLASCLPDDASNVYVVLTARGLNPDLHIVVRAVEEQAEPTLIRAGASRVVAPTIIGSQSMARALLKPAIADFMDSIVAESLDLVFEEIAIDATSPYAGKALKDTDLLSALGLMVVAIRQKDGELIFNPKGSNLVSDGDLLIVIGKAESVKGLKQGAN
jgi:voltage-gated potassium channel